jgi:hypothetical protein
MANRTGTTTSQRSAGKAKKPVVRKRGEAAASATAADAPPAEQRSGARALIRTALKALGEVPGDMAARQARIFELLLGIGQSPLWKTKAGSAAAPDPFGKFEAVFDQRVVRSLERLGMPSPQELKDLSDQVRALTAEVRKLQSKPRGR